MLDPDEVKELFDKGKHHGDAVLQTLLTAHRMTCVHEHFAAADDVERAVYKFRESERDRLMYEIQQQLRR